MSRAWISAYLNLAGGQHDGRPEAFANTVLALAAARSADYASAIAHADTANAGLAKFAERSYEWLSAQFILDVSLWATNSDPDFFGSVERLRSELAETGTPDPHFDRLLDLYGAWGCVAEAKPDAPGLRSFVIAAASGQHAGLPSDALAILAELERAAGNNQLGRQLILSSGISAEAASMIAAGIVAKRLDVHDE